MKNLWLWAVVGIGGIYLLTRKKAAGVLPKATVGVGQVWYPGLADWTVIPGAGIAVPANAEVSTLITWVNNDTRDLTGNMRLTVIYPSGDSIEMEAVFNQDMTAAPGNGWLVQFAPFTTSEVGGYTLAAVLTVEGQVVSTANYRVTAS